MQGVAGNVGGEAVQVHRTLWYILLPPYYSFSFDVDGLVGVGTFVFACGIMIALVHWLRLTIEQLDASRAQAEGFARQAKLAEEIATADLRDMTRLNQPGDILTQADADELFGEFARTE